MEGRFPGRRRERFFPDFFPDTNFYPKRDSFRGNGRFARDAKIMSERPQAREKSVSESLFTRLGGRVLPKDAVTNHRSPEPPIIF
jgi:hypothetical protein